MATVFSKIQELEEINQLSKHEQLVGGIINAIDDKIICEGSMLPSVNNMVRELGFASQTIVKAYKELKERGIVASKNRLGYFVINENTEQTEKVALLLYAFLPFQEIFYNTFRTVLGDTIQVDIFFHHGNIELLETILTNIRGRYSMYAVTPIPHPLTKQILRKIPTNQLLIVDRASNIGKGVSQITQEFEISTYIALKELLPAIQKFDSLTLFFVSKGNSPIEVRRAFKQFLKDFKIKGTVKEAYKPGSLKAGNAYFTIGDGDLWAILKDCKKLSLKIGKDVGILSNNDGPAKEIICDGITTISTDFERMAREAAEFILHRKKTQKIIPTLLIRRKSL